MQIPWFARFLGRTLPTILSYSHAKLCGLDLFMRCQPLVTDTYRARQLIAKTEQDHYTSTMTDCKSLNNEQRDCVQISLPEDEAGCFYMTELGFTLIKRWKRESQSSIAPTQLRYYWDKHSDQRQCFKIFVRDSRKSKATLETDSLGAKFAIYLTNLCECIHTFNMILQ
jgi:hypothetical protein